ncbi:hypothetical protein [Priestia megaterium]|uniref:hypothetical protein n=1 Tax=Priestia megaterium TaxID=1404 RepID=UPI001FB27064|nr:hypothetical protein [Priestia megaterium]
MESNRGEANSTPPVNLGEKEKKSFATSMMDASIIVLIFTGLTYLLGMKFKDGYLGYYKITDVMLGDVGMNYIIDSFTDILVLLMFWGVIYIVFLPILSAAKRTRKVLHLIMLLVALYTGILVLSMWVFNKILDEAYGSILGFICSIIALFDVIFTAVKEQMNKGKFPRLRKIIKSVLNKLNPSIWEIKLIIFDIQKNRYLKFVLLIPVIYFAILVFFHLGETEAQRRDEYLIIKYEEKVKVKVKDKKTGKEKVKVKVKETDYVVITESKNNLLIAPVDLDDKVITPTYSIIEAKSKFKELVKLEAMKFNDGLKVEKVKAK